MPSQSSKPEHPFGGAEEPRPHWNDSGAKSEEEGVLSEVTEGIPLRPRTSAVNGPPPEWVFPLEVTLEELAQGSKQRYKILRRLLSGKKKRVVLEINICPGWKQGTRIKFPRSGNERPNKAPQDIVFVVEELPHERFLRVGSTLRGRMEMTLAQALAGEGGVYHITGIDGEKIAVPVPASPVKLGTETTVKGAGMPIRKDGQVVGRGDLVIEWDILFPERLLDSQVEALRTLLNQGGV
ncbi:hypothetical protein SISSUDRAFT_984061 [Sistotremastrum suecicum HHB10207 ss-3]|uniref:Chaperone DnaJ C-terminal domain-containing protein n=1 Tax=Sistotremastrum suecicum HHB10207 ss-3 TaxID=1314776 RepID=A0A166EWY0_9AGAM|nr:hypothetical protein SISSUDRAFT_984061 [Sistotremastrum suecicum HHB10207 ss-3]